MRAGRGILLMILAVTMFTAMNVCIKAAAVPAGQAVFFRAGLSVPVLLLWLAFRGQVVDGLRTSRPWVHVRRGVVGSVSMGLGFAGLLYLPLPEVTALQFVTPILIVLMAAVMLGERMSRGSWGSSSSSGRGSRRPARDRSFSVRGSCCPRRCSPRLRRSS